MLCQQRSVYGFFLVVMYGCESWTIKKAEHWGIYAFELWCWRRLLRVPWITRSSNQSILKEINPEYSLEGLMLSWSSNTLATSCKELTHWKKPWCWEGLGAGGEGDNRGWDGWMASLTRWTWVWVDSGSWWETARPGMLWFMGLPRVGHNWATELNWTRLHHTRPPCLSPTSRAYPNSSPSSGWCHPTIPSSVISFSSCPQSFLASGSFQMSPLFTSGGQSIGVSASASVLPMNTQDWSPLEWTGWISLQSKGLSRVFSNTTVQKHQFFSAQLSSQSNSHIHTWLLEKP